jgi:hypothetical protein
MLNLKAKTNKKIKNETKTPQVAAKEHNIVNIHSEDTHWPKKRSDLRLKRLDLDLQNRSKVTCQKRRPNELTEKTPSTVIMKREEGDLSSSCNSSWCCLEEYYNFEYKSITN